MVLGRRKRRRRRSKEEEEKGGGEEGVGGGEIRKRSMAEMQGKARVGKCLLNCHCL